MRILPSLRLKNKKRKFLVFVLISGMYLFLTLSEASSVDVNAQSSSSVLNQINDLEGEMQSLNSQIQNEQSQIKNLNGKIQTNAQQVTTLQTIVSQKEQLITEKETQIALLNQSIQQQQTDIATLTAKINSLYADFVQRAKESYEASYVNPVFLALGTPSITNVFVNLEYFADTRKADASLLSEMQDTEYTLQQKLQELDVQQSDLQNAETDLIAEKKDLLNQQSTLQTQIANEKAVSNQQEQQLSSNQAQYQALVNEINNLEVATFSGNGGCVKGDYWYYNQQCYGRLPGMYGTSINMTYGCLITDIAMVATKELGQAYTPPRIASMTYFSDNSMMAWPNLPGLSPVDLGYQNISAINSEIAQGYPVIVYLSAPDGQHWVVFDGTLAGGNHRIQDPWYGSELTFNGTDGGKHEYYSNSEIGEAFALR